MDCETEISLRVEKIKTIFQAAHELSNVETDLDILTEWLDKTDAEFRSIAYEGASMGIALKNLAADNTLSTWHTFLKKSPSHTIQIHVGLGWAIAQQNYSVLPHLGISDAFLISRVLNGLGYYDGIFRQRNSVKSQKIPSVIRPEMQSSYDQGIGRSLWYNIKGNIPELQKLISGFSSDRHSALWTGVGIACAYVGGCDQDLLNSLFIAAQPYQDNLAMGAIIVVKSRAQTDSITKDIELACKAWFNISDSDLWLSEIEKVLIPSHDITVL